MAHELQASVIVPTRNRLSALRRCIDALVRQETQRPFEIIVVDDDDTATTRIALPRREGDPPLRVVRSHGCGPAIARNAGIKTASAPVILFTDDDTMPDARWLESACAFLEKSSDYVGVEGVTMSLPYDSLYEHSVESHAPGRFMTCNMAFRKHVLIELGGFDEHFPTPHCEDLDLAFRALHIGPIGFDERMSVVHTPRRLSLLELIRRASLVSSEVYLFRRHRDRWHWHIPIRVAPMLLAGARWWREMEREGWQLLRDPARCGRLVAAATGQLAVMAALMLKEAAAEMTDPGAGHAHKRLSKPAA